MKSHCSSFKYYVANVQSAQDYYPFGMVMPGRSFQGSDGYRYGFNGMEKDDEVKGDNNSLDFGARGYDPRVARWYRCDPLQASFPHESPYIFAGCSPVLFMDPDGEKKTVYMHFYDKEGKEIMVVEKVDEKYYTYGIGTYNNGYGDQPQLETNDVIQHIHYYPDGTVKEDKPYEIISQTGFFKSLWENIADEDGLTISIWGTGSNGMTPWNDSDAEPIAEIDMKDPFWGAFFGALQKEKYKDAVSAISNIDKIPEAFKNIAEAFKTAYTMEDVPDDSNSEAKTLGFICNGERCKGDTVKTSDLSDTIFHSNVTEILYEDDE